MTWQLLVAAYLILGTATYLLLRKLGRSLAAHRRLISAFFFVAIHYPLGLIVASFMAPDLSIGWLNIIFLLIGSWIFPLINVLALRASKHVDAGLFTILNNLTPIVTIAAASLLLHEQLTDTQLLGAAIIIVSAFLVTFPSIRHHAKNSASGLLLAVAVVSLLGLATVYERWMLTRIDLGAYLVFGWGAQTLWMVVMAWPARKQLKILRKKENFIPILAYSLTSSLKGLCFVGALKLSSSASLVVAFASFMPVLVVPAAYLFLGERKHVWFKIAAAIAGTVGLVILNAL